MEYFHLTIIVKLTVFRTPVEFPICTFPAGGKGKDKEDGDGTTVTCPPPLE